MASADRYRPKPKTVWLAKLRRQFLSGVGVRDAAKPEPMAGCITSSGAATVQTPTANAGSRVGLRTQSAPWRPTSTVANAMPTA